MARRVWKDKAVEFPRRFNIQNNPDGTVTLIPAPGEIIEPGTPVNASNLNGLEDDLATHMADNVHIPKGLISMWSGLITAIPNGWVLCNGQNGTPDLRDRFVMGATSQSDMGETGGDNEVTLTVDQIPAHKHSGSTNSAGTHTHPVGSGSTGNYFVVTSNGPNQGSLTTRSAGAHSHTVTIDNTGGGQAHENRPAYYKLAFIMKV